MAQRRKPRILSERIPPFDDSHELQEKSRAGDRAGGDAIMLLDSDPHDILAPDALLASQFVAPRNGLPEAERSLVVAVLEDAVRCLLNHCRSSDRDKRVLHGTAEEWFRSTGRTDLYAFENVCDILDLDPDHLRRRLFAKRDQLRASDRDVTPAAVREAMPAERRRRRHGRP